MTACTVTPIIGYPKLNEWAGVACNQSGNFVCAFAVSGEGANNLGKDISDQLKQFEPRGAQDLHQGLLDLLAQVRKANNSIQFACSLAGPEKIVFGSFGGTIIIKKDQHVRELIGGSDQLQLIEGRRNELLVVMATDASEEYVAEIKNRLEEGYHVGNITSSLISAIQAESTPAQLAMAFLECSSSQATAAHLLAHASASPVLKQESPIKPQVSIESIDIDTQATSKQGTTNFSNPGVLPNRPSQFKRVWRDSVQNSKRIMSIGKQHATTLARKLMYLGGTTSKQVFKAASRLPALKTAYQTADTTTRKKALLVIIGTVAIAVAAIGFGIWKNQQLKTLTQRYDLAIQKPLVLRNEAEALLSSDPVLAREKANQLVAELEQLKPEYEKYYQLKTKLEVEINSAKDFVTTISGQQELSELQVFFDLRLTESSFLANSMNVVENTLYFLDSEKRQIVELNGGTKQFKIITLTGNQPIHDWTAAPKNLYFLGDGMYGYNLADATTTELKEVGDSDRDGTLLRQFDAYLYVFNPIKRNIFRFTFTKTGLSQGIGWITDKKNLDFNLIRDMAVDGSVWLTTKDGQIMRYLQGQAQTFEIDGLAEPFNSPLQISTSDTHESIYVLEPEQQRVVILSKTGKLIKQIKSAPLSAATDIVVSDNPRMLFVLSGSTVYTIPLD